MSGVSGIRFARAKIDHIDPVCVECGNRGQLVSGAKAYPKDPKRRDRAFYACVCGALVSCHPGTAIAAGRPASASTRYLRSQAHDLFDPLWRGSGRSPMGWGYARAKAYKRLAAELGIRPEECHFGMMGAEMLGRVISICKAKVAAARAENDYKPQKTHRKHEKDRAIMESAANTPSSREE